jgi:uncharacterized membrane protein
VNQQFGRSDLSPILLVVGLAGATGCTYLIWVAGNAAIQSGFVHAAGLRRGVPNIVDWYYAWPYTLWLTYAAVAFVRLALLKQAHPTPHTTHPAVSLFAAVFTGAFIGPFSSSWLGNVVFVVYVALVALLLSKLKPPKTKSTITREKGDA